MKCVCGRDAMWVLDVHGYCTPHAFAAPGIKLFGASAGFLDGKFYVSDQYRDSRTFKTLVRREGSEQAAMDRLEREIR